MHASIAADAVAGRANWDWYLRSPAARCADLARVRRLPTRSLPELRERGFGTWEGLRADQIPIADLSISRADPTGYDSPDAKPCAGFRERILQGRESLLSAQSTGASSILLLSRAD